MPLVADRRSVSAVNGSLRRFVQRIEDGARVLLHPFEPAAVGELEPGRLGHAAQLRAGHAAALLHEHGEAHLDVDVGAQAVERLGAIRFRRDVAARDIAAGRCGARSPMTRRKVSSCARLAGAVAVGEQQARRELDELAARVGREQLPRALGRRAPEPAQALAEPRMQSRRERADADRLARAARSRCTRSRDRARGRSAPSDSTIAVGAGAASRRERRRPRRRAR